MKKTILYTVCLAVLTMTGCDKTVLEFPENGGIDPTLVNVNLTLAIDPKIESYEPSERSKVSEADLHDVRWIVEVFRDEIGGDLVEQRVLSCEQAVDGHHTIRTSLTLHAARYQIVAWMDYVDNGSTADKYYNVNSLSSISVPEAGNYIGDEDHKDTYIAQQEIDLKNYRDRWNMQGISHRVSMLIRTNLMTPERACRSGVPCSRFRTRRPTLPAITSSSTDQSRL